MERLGMVLGSVGASVVALRREMLVGLLSTTLGKPLNLRIVTFRWACCIAVTLVACRWLLVRMAAGQRLP